MSNSPDYLRFSATVGRPRAPHSRPRSKNGAPRRRSLLLEQFEPRVLLDGGPNTAPTAQSHIATAVEDTVFHFAPADFPFTDAESNGLAAVKIDTIPVVGSLALFNPSNFTATPVTVDHFISAADIIAGNLIFQGALNASGLPYTSFTFQVQDNGGTAVVGGVASADLDPTPRTETINVLSVNDAPRGADRQVTIPEDNQYQFSITDFGFSDPNDTPPVGAGPANALAGIVIDSLPPPQSGSLILNHALVVSVGEFISATDIGGLVFRPAANAFGSPLGTFTFRVKDDGGTAVVFGSDGRAGIGVDTDFSARTMTFSVTPVSDAPVGNDNAVTTAEDTPYTFAASDFGFTDPSDVPPNNFAAVKITTLPASGALMVNGGLIAAGTMVPAASVNAGQLKFVPFPSASDSAYASFTFQVQDTGSIANGGSNLDPTPNTIAIRVLNVNDPPSSKDATVSYIYGGGHGTTLPLSLFSFTDLADFPENGLAGVKIVTLPASGVLTDGGNAVAAGQVIAAADFTSGLVHYQPTVIGFPFLIQDAFTFQIQDDGGTANGGNDLDPTPRTMRLFGYSSLGDPPVAQPDRVVTIREDNVYTFSPSDFDFTAPQDGDSVQSITISSLPLPGILRYLGAAVPMGMVIPVAGLRQGLLQFTPYANGNGPLYSTFGASVQDTAPDRGLPYTIGFNVLPVNDAPIGGNNSVTTNEDTSYTFGVSDFGFSDYYDLPANNFYTVRIVSAPAAGLLTCGGVPVKPGDIVLVTDIAAGKLRFTPATNGNGAAYASFSYRLQDDGGTANGGIDIGFSTNTLTINVTPVNDPPVGMNGVVAMQEDTSYTFGAFSFGFSDAADLPLQNSLRAVEITTLPDKGTLTLGGTVVGNTQFISAVDLSAGNLRFTPAANAIGSPYTSFTFQVQDDGGTLHGGGDLDLTPRTMTINVFQPPCEAPIGSNLIVTAVEDTPYAFHVSDFPASFCSDGLSLLAVRIMSLPTSGTLLDNGALVQNGQFVPVTDLAAGKLVYTPPPDRNGSPLTAFTFEVQDDGGTAGGRIDLDSAPRTMAINVQAVNDPPTSADGMLTMLEDVALGFSPANFSFNDASDNPIPNTFQSVIITSLPTSGTLKVGGNLLTSSNLATAGQIPISNVSQLLFTPSPSSNDGNTASPSFTFKVKDNGGTAFGGRDTSLLDYTLTISVSGVNDAPRGQPNTVTTPEDYAYTFATSDFGFTDPNDQPPNAFAGVRITTVPAVGTLMNSGNLVAAGDFITQSQIAAGFLIFRSAPNGNGSDYSGFTFQVKDNGGTARGGIDLDLVPRLMTINVTSVNDAPMATDRLIPLLSCNISYVFTASDFGFSDPYDSPADQLAAVIITRLPAVESLTDAGLAAQVGQVIPAADLSAGKLVVSFAGGVPVDDSFLFQVQDDGGTAHGGMDTSVAPNTLSFHRFELGRPPISIDRSVTAVEDRSYIFTAADFSLPDDDDLNPPDGVTLVSLPAIGLVQDNGTPVAAGQFIPYVDVVLGALTFTPPANANGQALTSFVFQVPQLNACNMPAPAVGTLTMNVQPVNDPPQSANGRVTTLEDHALVLSAADFPFSDPHDLPPTANNLVGVKITTIPAGGILLENGVLIAAGDFVSIHDIQAGGLQFVPAVNGNGLSYASFTFQVKDDGGTANGGIDLDPTPRTIVVSVTPVNDRPALAMPSSINTTDESGPQTIVGFASAIAGPPDEAGQALHFVVANISHPELFSVQPAIDPTGKLTFTPAPNASGSADVQVVVQDDGGTANGGIDRSQPQTLTIEVAKAHADHNAVISTDVTGDGFTTPSDALSIINFINAFGSQRVSGEGEADVLYLDVNADGFVAPSDALAVINWIDSYGTSQGEGPADGSNDWMTLLAVDVSQAAKKLSS